MNDLTFKQKQIISNYLEESISSCGTHATHLSVGYLKEEIKKLKTITFGDIKNQVGIKFNIGDGKYAIGFNREFQSHHVIDLKTFSINHLDAIYDDEVVEIINEA